MFRNGRKSVSNLAPKTWDLIPRKVSKYSLFGFKEKMEYTEQTIQKHSFGGVLLKTSEKGVFL